MDELRLKSAKGFPRQKGVRIVRLSIRANGH